MSHFRKIYKTERTLRRSDSAWKGGQLDAAIEGLREILDQQPDLWEAIFPLARALGEDGDCPEALRVLDEAEARLGPNEAARVFRLLILYDAGEVEALRACLGEVDQENMLARSIKALLVPNEASIALAALPGAIWLPDIAGRLLALVEDQLHARDPAVADAFHHSLFVPEGSTTATPSKSRPKASELDNARAWWTELERCFFAKDFAAACRLGAHDKATEWTDLESGVYLAFSLIVSGKEKEALKLAQRLRLKQPGAADLHFVEGLAWSRLRQPLAAGLPYVRAARMADTDLHYVLSGVEKELGKLAETAATR